MTEPNPLHSLTWLLWAVAAATCIQLAPNPLYVLVVIGVAGLVVEAHRADAPLPRAFSVLLGIAVVFSLIRIALMVLTTHSGGASFATVPEFTLPRLLGGFTVGGPLEWAVLWQVAAESLAVIGIMAAFGAFNAVASHSELLQSAPRAFHEPGLVLTVAMAFVPSTITAVDAVREADKARTGGRVVRRGRAVRLVVPVLESGLERALLLSESMDARGYGRGGGGRMERASAWLGLATLLAAGGTLVALVGQATVAAAALAVLAGVCLVAAVVLAPAGDARTRYRPRRLTRVDALVLALCTIAVLGVGLLSAAGDGSLIWRTTLPLSFPSFRLVPVAFLALLAAPALVVRR